jgi:hypothetical protein
MITTKPLLTEGPASAVRNVMFTTDDTSRLPTIAEAAGNAQLGLVDRYLSQLRESRLKREGLARIQQQAISAATEIIVFKLRQDELYLKSKILVEDHERSGRLKSEVTQLVREAVEKNSAHLFAFEMHVAEEEKRRLDVLGDKLARGAITQERYQRSVANIAKAIDRDLALVGNAFGKLIDEVMNNVAELARR